MELRERDNRAPRRALTQTEKPMFAIRTALLGLFVAISAGAQTVAPSGGPLEPLCRDFREYTERRPMVDRQQVALLPKFQMLEEVCLNEAKPAKLSSYTCTIPSRAPAKGSCCAGPWDCVKSAQASCESMEQLCRSLGAAWSKE
jgi:hypothetical protein